ncbi:hypothetical protein TeGR_g5921 [Tetraparma gracilis]|uniref:Uncharacterized protein n=1 Tax=Tetraparma gracilis TaxID=2962635 RepID=A0ABQ6MEI3_9STRA|nr:hypothetical protein TeGR_g5921 [Tetraparma gracilis]
MAVRARGARKAAPKASKKGGPGTNAEMRKDHDARARKKKKKASKGKVAKKVAEVDEQEKALLKKEERIRVLYKAFTKAASGTAWLPGRRVRAFLEKNTTGEEEGGGMVFDVGDGGGALRELLGEEELGEVAAKAFVDFGALLELLPNGWR